MITLGIYSDLHKDVFGFRPRSFPKTRDELAREFDRLVEISAKAFAQQEEDARWEAMMAEEDERWARFQAG